jgi:ATP-dependent DNA ligase
MMANSMLEKSLVGIKLSTYGVASAGALKNPTLVPQVQNYKRQIASQMYPLGKEDIGRKIPDAEYLVSRKIDGEFTALVFDNGEILAVNPGGTVRIGMPWQEEAARLLTAAGIKQAMIAGELYVANNENRRPRVHDVVSVARQPENAEDLQRLRFAVFDWIQLNGEIVERPYSRTFAEIEKVFGSGKLIHPVDTVRLKGHRDIERQFEKWVEQAGDEGLVVRGDSAGTFKVKPRHNLDAVVIGFTESTDDRQGMLHDLLLGLARRDGSIHVLGRVGGGFSDDDRRVMLSDLNDMIVESEYAEVNSDHVAYQMVEPKWVIEISCLDLIAQNTRGGPVNRMVLNWNRGDKRYEVVRRLPLVSVISPQFVRIRDDKTLDPTDVRLSQVTDLVPVAMTDVEAGELKLPKSRLLQREVYTKQLRGELLVRKFLLWKTNKQSESEEFPGYVIQFTDFSPSRKTPLTRDVRVSNSETQSITLFRGFKEENVKQGWGLHSQSGAMIADPDAEIAQSAAEKSAQAAAGKPEKQESKKPAEKKATPRKGSAKKPTASKSAKKKSDDQVARTKTAVKKSTAKKPPAKKPPAKKTGKSSKKKT